MREAERTALGKRIYGGIGASLRLKRVEIYMRQELLEVSTRMAIIRLISQGTLSLVFTAKLRALRARGENTGWLEKYVKSNSSVKTFVYNGLYFS